MGSTHSTKKNILYPHPIVETEYGLIEGMNVLIPKDSQKRIAKVFLGLPFAAPPLGNLRFEQQVIIIQKFAGC
uniref:Carboxylesterase type B domain-containing protein n=1 Tax=Panagrolaimus superbus TaxID=310955 RepID=A0A914YIP9_9BILA